MDNAQREIRYEIESARAGMAEKIATLEQRLERAVEEVKHSVDPKYQTQKRPWFMTGLSVAAGYLAGRIVFGASSRRPESWHERAGDSHRSAGIAQNLTGMVSGVVTAVGVSLAREFAGNLLAKRHGREQSNGANGSATDSSQRRFQ